MSARPTFALSPESVRGFAAMVDEVSSTIKKDVPSGVRFMLATLARSLVAATPQAPKNRRLVEMVDPRVANDPAVRLTYMLAQPKARFGIEVWSQGKSAPSQVWAGTREKAIAHPQYPIRHRGVAKRSWWAALAKAGGKGGGSASPAVAHMARLHSFGRFVEADGRADAMMINRVPYIETLDRGSPRNPPYNILGTAYVQGAKRLEWLLTQQANRMARNWRRA